MDDHKRQPWHCQTISQVYAAVDSSEEGLSDAEAAKRLRLYGRNTLRSRPPKTILQMLKAQVADPMVLILVGAAAFSAILREWTEASVIFAIVILNAVIGIVQELSLIHIYRVDGNVDRVAHTGNGDGSLGRIRMVVAGRLIFIGLQYYGNCIFPSIFHIFGDIEVGVFVREMCIRDR